MRGEDWNRRSLGSVLKWEGSEVWGSSRAGGEPGLWGSLPAVAGEWGLGKLKQETCGAWTPGLSPAY